jgi:serine/threonine-protein kinase RsbW
MVNSTQCGQARTQPVSQVPRASKVTAGAHGTEDAGQVTVSGDEHLLLLWLAAEEHGTVWERAYPGTADQLRYLRAALRPPLRCCPIAEDAILLMSELGGNAVKHSRSREASGTFTARILDVPGLYVLGEIEDGGSDWSGDIRGSARNASGLDLLLRLSAACGVSG